MAFTFSVGIGVLFQRALDTMWYVEISTLGTSLAQYKSLWIGELNSQESVKFSAISLLSVKGAAHFSAILRNLSVLFYLETWLSWNVLQFLNIAVVLNAFDPIWVCQMRRILCCCVFAFHPKRKRSRLTKVFAEAGWKFVLIFNAGSMDVLVWTVRGDERA